MIAFPLVAIAELLVVFVGFGVWAHHMFATGIPTTTLVFFAGASAMVVIPSTIQVFAWSSTIFTGLPRFKTPLLFIVGFILFFVAGGLTGIMFIAIPFDQQMTDTYFVVAHFHYIIFGAAVFPIFGGMYYWFPKVTGRMYFERPGQISFWIIFVGTNLLFFPMHIVGLLGMPRRVYTYPGGVGWTVYNVLESIGGFVTLSGILLLLGNLVISYRRGPRAGPDPWHGPTLEWTVPSPPPEYNFAVVPRVKSAYPNWDADAGDAGALDDGHEQMMSTPIDGRPDEVVHMPNGSPWPILLALCLSGIFGVLVIEKYGVAAVFGVLLLLVSPAGTHRSPRKHERARRNRARPCPSRAFGRTARDGDVRPDGGDALRDADRHLLLPPVQEPPVAAARERPSRRSSCRCSCSRHSLRRACRCSSPPAPDGPDGSAPHVASCCSRSSCRRRTSPSRCTSTRRT